MTRSDDFLDRVDPKQIADSLKYFGALIDMLQSRDIPGHRLLKSIDSVDALLDLRQ